MAEAIGKGESQPLRSALWETWSFDDAIYRPPDPERFSQTIVDIPRGDLPHMARVVVLHAFERTGLLLSPAQLSAPLELLGSSDSEDYKIIDDFLEYCDLADKVWETLEEAHHLSGLFTLDQIRQDLPDAIKKRDRLPPAKVIKAMNKSDHPAFDRVSSIVKSDALAIFSVMYAWEKNLKLPNPPEAEDAVE